MCVSADDSCYQLMKFGMEDGTCERVSVGYEGYNFLIEQSYPNGTVSGIASCANHKTFFYYKDGRVTIIPPVYTENFREYTYRTTIHG